MPTAAAAAITAAPLAVRMNATGFFNGRMTFRVSGDTVELIGTTDRENPVA